MKKLTLCFALVLSLLPGLGRAQVEASISIGLPVVPPMVVVQPGVQVVEGVDEEVFFVVGWYWCRRGPHWYRARGPHASFAYVQPGYVPTRLAYLPPPGHYRHWHRDRLGEEHRWWREHDHERRQAWREHERHAWRERHGDHGPGPGHFEHGGGRGHGGGPAHFERGGGHEGGGHDRDHDRGDRGHHGR